MNRRERRAARQGRYPQAQYYAIHHNWRLARRNFAHLQVVIALHRNPLMGRYYQ